MEQELLEATASRITVPSSPPIFLKCLRSCPVPLLCFKRDCTRGLVCNTRIECMHGFTICTRDLLGWPRLGCSKYMTLH